MISKQHIYIITRSASKVNAIKTSSEDTFLNTTDDNDYMTEDGGIALYQCRAEYAPLITIL